MSASYFVIHCPEPRDWDDSALLGATPLPPGAISWRVGQRFPNPPAEPIVIEMNATHSDQLCTWYDVDAVIMPRALLDTLRAFGVDNLDAYSALIRHPKTGFQTEDYVAVNLIGLVSAVDIGSSNVVGGSSDHKLDTDFEGFAIDPAKAHDLPMFRLAENTSAILVHERLRDHLKAAGFSMLRYMKPEKFVG
jgi:hypothetical protein